MSDWRYLVTQHARTSDQSLRINGCARFMRPHGTPEAAAGRMHESTADGGWAPGERGQHYWSLPDLGDQVAIARVASEPELQQLGRP